MNMQGNLGRNIPQPQGMPQGIASLGGMSPSPRAGIGNVQDRVDAFRQNPQALQTPPNVPPDLLDALALQKIMSEKEAAKREMAMAQPGQQPTIMQQLEQKALGDTKQEIAQQVGGVAQKQEQDKQQAMQRLMSGIAQAPGAGQVMPARMAGGGIVAFQNRGEVPPVVDPREIQRILRKSPMARTPEENEILRQSGIQLERRRMGSEGIVQRAERGLQQIGPAARQYLTEGAAGLSPEELEQRSDTGAITEKLYRMLGGQQTKPPAPGMSEADLQDLMPTRQPLPQTPLPPEMGVGQPPQASPGIRPPMGMGASNVKPPAAPGIVGALQQPPLPKPPEGGIAVQPQATPSLTEVIKGTGVDSEATRKERAAEAANVYGLSPEEKAFYEERIQRMRGEMQPKETRWYERLGDLAAQMGPASSTIAGTLGGVARTGRTMQLDEQARRQKQQEQLDALREKMLGGARTGREKGFEAGISAEEKAMQQQAQLGQIGVGIEGIKAQREGTASREAQSEADRISREAIAKMDDRTRRFVADLQARTRQGGELNPDDLAKIRANATKAVEESLMKDGRYLTLKQKDPAAAERQKQEAIEKMSRDLVQYARSGGATAASAAPAAGQKVIDFASIGAK